MSYSQLQSDVENFHHRADLATHFPMFVRLAEARFNARLHVRRRQVDYGPVTPTNGVASLPSDFHGFAWLKSGNRTLEVKDIDYVRDQYLTARDPLYYAIDGSNIILDSSSGELTGSYYQTIPALTATNTTNWLDDYRPDLYLFGCLHYAYTFMQNYAKADKYLEMATNIMNEMIADDEKEKLDGSPIIMRVK